MPDPAPDPEPLRPATPEEIAESLGYALLFDSRGKPLGVKARADAKAMARRLVEHLELSRYVVMRRPPLERHTVGPDRKW